MPTVWASQAATTLYHYSTLENKKQKTDTNENSQQATIPDQVTECRDKETNTMLQHLNDEHSEFISNVLYYIAGYIVSKLIDNLSCSKCKKVLSLYQTRPLSMTMIILPPDIMKLARLQLLRHS